MRCLQRGREGGGGGERGGGGRGGVGSNDEGRILILSQMRFFIFSNH